MNTRRQILAAAQALFARQGYDSATMEQIAQAVGLTKGAVYYFFKNKAELFCMIVDEGVSYIEEECLALLDEQRSSRDIAQDVISFCMNIAYDNASLFLILFGSRSADPQIRALFDERIQRLLGCIQNTVQSGIDDGLLRPVSPDIFSRMFAGMVYGLLALPDCPDRTAATEALRMLLETGIYAPEAEKRS